MSDRLLSCMCRMLANWVCFEMILDFMGELLVSARFTVEGFTGILILY